MSSTTEAFRTFIEALRARVDPDAYDDANVALISVLGAAREALKVAIEEEEAQERRDWEEEMGDDL